MRKYNTDALIFVVLLVVLVLILLFGYDGLDIQLHDTYFVISMWHLMIIVLEPLTFVAFLVRAFATAFQKVVPLIGLTVGLLAIGLGIYKILELRAGYHKALKEEYRSAYTVPYDLT
jgi:heme/copper-type cytochrome/quinol oxidase subunit 1